VRFIGCTALPVRVAAVVAAAAASSPVIGAAPPFVGFFVFVPAAAAAAAAAATRGLHSFTLEFNLTNFRTHSWLGWVTRWTEELKLSWNRNECQPLLAVSQQRAGGSGVGGGEGGGGGGGGGKGGEKREEQARGVVAQVEHCKQKLRAVDHIRAPSADTKCKQRGARAKAWCLLIHEEGSSLSLPHSSGISIDFNSLKLAPPYRGEQRAPGRGVHDVGRGRGLLRSSEDDARTKAS